MLKKILIFINLIFIPHLFCADTWQFWDLGGGATFYYIGKNSPMKHTSGEEKLYIGDGDDKCEFIISINNKLDKVIKFYSFNNQPIKSFIGCISDKSSKKDKLKWNNFLKSIKEAKSIKFYNANKEIVYDLEPTKLKRIEDIDERFSVKWKR